MTHPHSQPDTSDEPMNITNSIRCALARHDAGYAWEIESEDVAKLLAAYDRLTVPRSGVRSESDLSGLGTVDVHVFADVYTFCFDDGLTYTPNDHEKAMLEDAINGYIAECEQRQAEAAPSLSSADGESDLETAHRRIQELQGENDILRDKLHRAQSPVGWGTEGQ